MALTIPSKNYSIFEQLLFWKEKKAEAVFLVVCNPSMNEQ